VARGDKSVPAFKDRLLRAFDAWSGRHPERPARLARGEPAVMRIIAPLAVLVVIAALACAGFGYVLARQADDDLDAERRQALTGAVEVLQATIPGLGRIEPSLIPVLERLTGLKRLKFDPDPPDDDRVVQSVIDRKGRIIGWLTWEAERPATAMVTRLGALIVFIVLGLIGFAALAMWQLSRLGLLLARSEQQVHKLTYEDPLTGLPNHSQLFDLLDQAITTLTGDGTLVYAVIDLDGFDEVNDAVGYAGGDVVLVEIAKRLREVAPDAVLARLGSDEFALLMADIDREAALQIADAVRHAIARPIWMNQFVQVVASIGLVLIPEDGTAREELTRRADLALRAAKRRGHGGAVAYTGAMEAEIQERRFIKREVARAIAARGFDLHYQPIVRAERGAIAGVEALLRWTHPTRGPIPPSVFVPVAEEAGLMDRLGEFVLRRAIADAARWPDLYVSVNLSPVQIRDRGFVDVVSAVLKESGLEPSRLVLEMTEGVLIDNPDEMAVRLLELRALGVQLALDDFGSGYSSLSYLQRLPFNKVKIDRSFVTSLDHSANGGVIIQAVVTLCRALGMSVVIEGVETEEQRVLVRLAGCNEMQGYLFAKPAPREEIDRLLTEAKSP
jgi:diguanylate cyclase (GGDEF)-like protein